MLTALAQTAPASETDIGVKNFGDFWELTLNTWTDGGWLMPFLFILVLFIFFEAISLVVRLDKARLAMPFWWTACAFFGALNPVLALTAKSFILSLIGMGIGDGQTMGLGHLGAVIAFGLIVNPGLWVALATMKMCQKRVLTQATWEPWVQHPEQAPGHIGEIVRFIVGRELNDESVDRLEAVRSGMIPEINRRISVLSALVTLAPLMGLLGTVIGMLDTFRGLSESSGQAAELVANGIRVALVTTQTGLTIAIPGYIFVALAIASRNNYGVFLTELESLIVKRIHRSKQVQA
jgi:biopolymer transport protein ExbB|tara:strand:- start:7321 stop:8199 length:879 start_codon:yes stop_codon:yes gene_type:complete